jgi:hypothetical protein
MRRANRENAGYSKLRIATALNLFSLTKGNFSNSKVLYK